MIVSRQVADQIKRKIDEAHEARMKDPTEWDIWFLETGKIQAYKDVLKMVRW